MPGDFQDIFHHNPGSVTPSSLIGILNGLPTSGILSSGDTVLTSGGIFKTFIPTNSLTVDASGNIVSDIFTGTIASLPIADLISADAGNLIEVGTDGKLWVQPVVVYDDQELTMVNTNSISGTLTPLPPVGPDNQVNYVLTANVNIDPNPLNAITVGPAGLMVDVSAAETTTNFVSTVSSGNAIGTYTNEDGVVQVVNETITTVVPNGDGTFTFTNEAGVSTVFGNANLTSMVDNGDGTFTFTNEAGVQTIISDASVSTMVDNGDGTYTYTNEAGVTTTIGDTTPITVTPIVTVGHDIATVTNELGVTSTIKETITTLNVTGSTVTHTSEDGTVKTFSLAENVTYSASPVVFPASPIVGDELFVTTTGAAGGEILEEYIFSSANVWEKRPTGNIVIPTPRLWARQNTPFTMSGQQASALASQSWSVPSLYAQQFSEDSSVWRSLNPVYELLVLKKVSKRSSNIRNGVKWVHPVHLRPGATGKKYAGGQSRDHNTSGVWEDRYTEWAVDVSTLPTRLSDFDPHDWFSYTGQTLTNQGVNPLVGPWAENSFDNRIYFPPSRGRMQSRKRKMPIAVRIRIDNPRFIAGVPNQEPYLYGDASNVLTVRPKMINLGDGTFDSLGRPKMEHYYLDWMATDEHSGQN